MTSRSTSARCCWARCGVCAAMAISCSSTRSCQRVGVPRLLSPVELQIDLARIPRDVEVVVLAASLDDRVPGSFAAHGNGFVVRDGAARIRHSFDGLSTERCVIAAEVYRRDGGWKLNPAVSQGYDHLARLVHDLGVESDTSTAPASQGAVTPTRASPPRSASPAPRAGAVAGGDTRHHPAHPGRCCCSPINPRRTSTDADADVPSPGFDAGSSVQESATSRSRAAHRRARGPDPAGPVRAAVIALPRSGDARPWRAVGCLRTGAVEAAVAAAGPPSRPACPALAAAGECPAPSA